MTPAASSCAIFRLDIGPRDLSYLTAALTPSPGHFPRQSPHVPDHFHLQPVEDLCLRVPGAQAHRPRHRQGRNLRAARAERRRQDHADQHHLRDRHALDRHGHRRRPRHPDRLPRRPLADRPGAAGAAYRRVRVGVGDGLVQPRAVRPADRSRPHREGAALAVAVGQEGRQDHDAVRRHEAARADRQGARARAAGPVPRRADRRRRRRAAQGHVERGARAARVRRHHHPHHALHRRSRGDGRPHRRHQQGRDHPGRAQGRADAEARQEGAHAAAARSARRDPGATSRATSSRWRRTARSCTTPTIPRASAPASPRCSTTSPATASASATCKRRKARSRTSSSAW